MGKGLLRKKDLEGLRLKGHDRDDDDDAVIHKGHDTFKGKGLGHSKGTKGSDGTKGSGGTKGSDGSGKCSDGSGKPTKGTGTKGSGTGTGGGDCHDYVCGGTLPCIEVQDGDTFVFDIDSPFRASGDGNTLYVIAGGADAGLFEVNASTGELSFREEAVFDDAPDADNNYEVTVRAIDIFNPCRPKDVKLCVEVTEDDVTSGGPGVAPTLSVTQLTDTIRGGANGNGGQVIATMIASDADGDPLSLTLSGPDADAFIIVLNDDPATAELEADLVIKAGNANSQGGANGVGDDDIDAFEVIITVDDGTGLSEASELTFQHVFTAG